MVNLYIADSLKPMQRQSGIVGYVIESGKETISQFGSVIDCTKDQAQLRGLKYALCKISVYDDDIRIYTDSALIKTAFDQDWIAGWIDRGWKTVKGKDVANKQEWQDVLRRLGERRPEVIVGTRHPYRHWLVREVERRINYV